MQIQSKLRYQHIFNKFGQIYFSQTLKYFEFSNLLELHRCKMTLNNDGVPPSKKCYPLKNLIFEGSSIWHLYGSTPLSFLYFFKTNHLFAKFQKNWKNGCVAQFAIDWCKSHVFEWVPVQIQADLLASIIIHHSSSIIDHPSSSPIIITHHHHPSSIVSRFASVNCSLSEV